MNSEDIHKVFAKSNLLMFYIRPAPGSGVILVRDHDKAYLGEFLSPDSTLKHHLERLSPEAKELYDQLNAPPPKPKPIPKRVVPQPKRK